MDGYARSYIAQGKITRGTAVVRGKKENQVTMPGAGGSGDFIGVYDALRNTAGAEDKAHVPIVASGLAKAVAGGAVTAGKHATIKDKNGALVVVPSALGTYNTVGVFLEDGSSGDFVDVLVERSQVTVA